MREISATSVCPDESRLRQFLTGRLDEQSVLEIGTHVDLCDSCRRSLDELADESDPLLAALGYAQTCATRNFDGISTTGNSNKLEAGVPEIPGYRILREVGRGGMGIVFEAEHLSLGRRVALKYFPKAISADELEVQRFQLEARTVARLKHDHIVQLYDVGSSENLQYYTMPLIDGSGLDRVIAEMRTRFEDAYDPPPRGRRRALEKLQPSTTPLIQQAESSSSLSGTLDGIGTTSSTWYRRAAEIIRAVADALAYTHSCGVQHRDVKPSNILLDASGKAWLADFGLAKPANTELTQTGQLVGTLRFIAPERFDGVSDARSDIYSLGSTLYELLSLQPAYRESTHFALVEQIRSKEPKQLRSIDRDIPVDLQTIVEKALHREPAHRYESAAQMAQDLDRFLKGLPILARKTSAFGRATRWAKRNPLVATTATTAVLLLILGLIGSTWAALRFRDLAGKQAELARQAEMATSQVQDELYSAEMRMASEAASSPGSLDRLQLLLEHWVPTSSEEVVRSGFEWSWLAFSAWRPHRVLSPGYQQVLQWSATGERIAWSGNDGVLHVSTWPEFALLSRTPLDSPARRAQFLPGGERIIVLDQSGTLSLIDVDRGQLFATTQSPQSFQSFHCSHDGQFVAALESLDAEQPKATIVILSAEDLTVVRRFTSGESGDGHPSVEKVRINGLSTVRWSSGDDYLAVSCAVEGKHGVFLWRTDNWQPERDLVWWSGQIQSFEWHPLQDSLILMSRERNLLIQCDVDNDLQMETPLETILNSVTWTSDGTSLVIDGNGSVRILDAATHEQQDLYHFETGSPVRPIVHPNQRDMIATVDGIGTLHFEMHDRPTVRLRHLISSPSVEECSIAWNRDGTVLSTSAEAGLMNWDLATAEPIPSGGKTVTEGEPVGWIESSSLGTEQLVSFYRKEIAFENRNFDGRIDTVVNDTEIQDASRRPVAFDSEQERLLLVYNHAYFEWGVSVWSRRTRQFVDIIPLRPGRPYCPGAWSPDGRLVALGVDHRLVVVDVTKREIVHDIPLPGPVMAVAWSHDGKRLASGGQDRQISIWETKNFQRIKAMYGHNGDVLTLDWSGDDTRLVSGGLDGVLRIWDMRIAQTALALKHPAGVGAARWSPDGKKLACMCLDGSIIIRTAHPQR